MRLEGITLPGIGGQPAQAPAATTQGGWANTLQTILPGVATALLSAKQTRELQKINIARAQAGLPPLDIAAYQEASAPVIKVQGGVDSGTSSRLGWGIFAAALVGALILANASNKK